MACYVDSISRRPCMCGACAASRRRAEDGGGGVCEEALLRGREGDGGRSRGERGWRGGPGTKGGRTLRRQGRWRKGRGAFEEKGAMTFGPRFFPSPGPSRGSLVPSGQSSNVAPKARPPLRPQHCLCSFLTSNSCTGFPVPQTGHAPSGLRVFAHAIPSARSILSPFLPG